MTKDPDLEAYVDAIEAHFRARRGSDHVLSPRDFALARAWHTSGVSLATVLVGIDAALEDGQEVTSLAYCRARVERLVTTGAGPQTRPRLQVDNASFEELEETLTTLLEGLGRLRPGPAACFEPPMVKAQEILDLIRVSSRPNWDYLRAKLQDIDEAVSEAVLHGLPPGETEAYRKEASRAVERHRGLVGGPALDDALTRHTIQRARERLGLPRVALI